MRNSPAALDLEDLRNRFSPPLQTALVAPLVHEGRTVGALSVYTAAPTAATPFSDDHQYALERIAALLGENIDLPKASASRHSQHSSVFATITTDCNS